MNRHQASPDIRGAAVRRRVGYAVGAAAKSVAFWVFAAFIPVLILALICAWVFTREPGTRIR
jgi:hypothetical protein